MTFVDCAYFALLYNHYIALYIDWQRRRFAVTSNARGLLPNSRILQGDKVVSVSSLCSYIVLVLRNHRLYVIYILKIEFRSCARGRQWCVICHYHWWTASIKPRLLCSLQAMLLEGFPFHQFNFMNVVVFDRQHLVRLRYNFVANNNAMFLCYLCFVGVQQLNYNKVHEHKLQTFYLSPCISLSTKF